MRLNKRIVAAICMLAAVGLGACSCGIKESDVYGSWRASRDGQIQTLELYADHTYRFVVEREGVDTAVVTMTGMWYWETVDSYTVDLQSCDVRHLGGKVPTGFRSDTCRYDTVLSGWLVGSKFLKGPDGAPDLRRLKQ